MADFARIVAGAPEQLDAGRSFVAPDGTNHSSAIYTSAWSDEERAAIGIVPIVEDVIPANKVTNGSTLEVDAGVVRRRWTLVDRPIRMISIAVLCRRIIQAGLWDAFSDFMNATPNRRRIWDEMKTVRDPIDPGDTRARTLLAGIGATQAQIDAIMAEP